MSSVDKTQLRNSFESLYETFQQLEDVITNITQQSEHILPDLHAYYDYDVSTSEMIDEQIKSDIKWFELHYQSLIQASETMITLSKRIMNHFEEL